MIDLREIGYVSSGYGKRDAPTAGASTNHSGLDIVLRDYNIPAVKSGVVTHVGFSPSGGNMVYVKHDDGVTARYLHMANPSPLSVGDTVKEGQTVGKMGSTGVSTGDHLHIDFQENGVTIDPDKYFDSAYSSASVSTSTDSSFTLVGKIVEFIVILLVVVLAVVLFMKAFDIKIM